VAIPDQFTDYLTATRALVDEALDRYLPKPPACPAIVSEAMRYSVFAGGKRLRPILTLAAADAVRRSGTPHTPTDIVNALALPAACAIEFIHTYSLIHDDLPAMDNDMLRRGRPTLHVVYGDGIAILAGDGLHAEAFTLLSREPRSPTLQGRAVGSAAAGSGTSNGHESDAELAARKLRVSRLIGEAAGPSGMVGGQTVDLQAAGQVPGFPLVLDEQGLQAMHARKTGALIRASAVSGAIMAGASNATIEAVDRYAREVGLAFQIVDDILDVEGDAVSLGKSAGKDAAGSKPTYPSFFGVDRSRTLAAECVARARVALEEGQIAGGWLPAIAEWVVGRKS
jgi:geranylgeranyl diphosphate synthase type II